MLHTWKCVEPNHYSEGIHISDKYFHQIRQHFNHTKDFVGKIAWLGRESP